MHSMQSPGPRVGNCRIRSRRRVRHLSFERAARCRSRNHRLRQSWLRRVHHQNNRRSPNVVLATAPTRFQLLRLWLKIAIDPAWPIWLAVCGLRSRPVGMTGGRVPIGFSGPLESVRKCGVPENKGGRPSRPGSEGAKSPRPATRGRHHRAQSAGLIVAKVSSCMPAPLQHLLDMGDRAFTASSPDQD